MDKVATPPFDGAFPDAEQAAVGWGTLHAPDKVKLHRDAAEALRNTESLFDSRRRELKHWMIVPGGYRQAIEAAADFWEERQQANAQCQGYRLTVSAFTDAEARDVSALIRERRRAAGELGPDRMVLAATDRNGERYSLALAMGDRVRLFRIAHTVFANGRTGPIGGNGSVLDIVDLTYDGARLKNQQGAFGFVLWDTLRAANGRVELSYGEALRADAVQSMNSTEHLIVMAGGSRLATRLNDGPAQTRVRKPTWLVISQLRETIDILAYHPRGDSRDVTFEEIRANVTRNLGTRPDLEAWLGAYSRASVVEPVTKWEVMNERKHGARPPVARDLVMTPRTRR